MAAAKDRRVLWIVFAFSISVVAVSSVPIMFPASLTLTGGPIPGLPQEGPDRFEAGSWSGLLIATNAAVFGLAFLHYKNRIPRMSGMLRRVFRFETSGRVTAVAMSVILATYIAASAGELAEEETYADWANLEKRLGTWSPDSVAGGYEPHVKYAITAASMQVFGNYAVLPFVASILLVILTYATTVQITQKRFAGIVSVTVLLQSNVFLSYDTSATYTNFWTAFYVASLYFAKRMWHVSPVLFLLSIPSKALAAMFAPMSIYYFLGSDMPRIRKAITAGATAAIVIGGAAAVVSGSSVGEAAYEGFDTAEFLMGFSSFANQLRWDGLVLLFCMPLIVGLFVASRRGVRHADSVMVMISGMLLLAPILTGFTNQTNQPYRFVPLVVFFSMGVGVLLSKVPTGGGRR